MRAQVIKTLVKTMHFHASRRATALCACYVKDGQGFDALGEGPYDVVTDDHGNQVFVQHRYVVLKAR